MTEDGKVTKTIGTVMVHLMLSKYKYVIKLGPINNLNIDILKKHFKICAVRHA